MKNFDRVLQEVESGLSVRDACFLVGVKQSDLQEYLSKNPDELDKIYAAEARAVRKQITNVRDAADAGNLQAATFLLKAARPEQFDPDKRVTVTHESKPTGPVALPSGDAKNKIYNYFLALCREDPSYITKLHQDLSLPALPEAEIDEPE